MFAWEEAKQSLSIWDGLFYYTAVRNQKAVSVYFASKQILLFGFADHYITAL